MCIGDKNTLACSYSYVREVVPHCVTDKETESQCREVTFSGSLLLVSR